MMARTHHSSSDILGAHFEVGVVHQEESGKRETLSPSVLTQVYKDVQCVC